MKRNIKNSIISIFLALVMVVTYTPMVSISGVGHYSTAMAEEVTDPEAYVVDGESYETFGDALSKAKSGATIILVKNVKGSYTVSAGKTLSIELAGKSLTAAGNITPVITNNGKLTISDAVGGGIVTGLISNKESGTLNIVGGSFKPINGKNTFSNSGEMTINGGSIASLGAYALENLKGNLYINGGSVEGITASSGKITISEGTVKGVSGRNAIYIADKSVEIAIKGGQIDASDGGANAVQIKNACKMTISGGTVKSDKYAINVDNESSELDVKVSEDAIVFGDIKTVSLGAIRLSGGYFDRKPDNSLCDDGCAAVIVSDRTDGVQYSINTGYFLVGEVGLFKKFTSALSAAGDNSTIKVVRDYSGSIEIPEGMTMTLNLNGKTINGIGTNSSGKSANHGTAIKNKGNLTVIDETGNGKVIGALINYIDATADLKGGNFENGTYSSIFNKGTLNYEGTRAVGISNNGGIVNIKGGTIEGTSNVYLSETQATAMKVSVFNMYGGKINLSSGTINGSNGIYQGSKSTVKVTGGLISVAGSAIVSEDSTLKISEKPSIVGSLYITGGTTSLTGGYYSIKPSKALYDNVEYTVVDSTAGQSGTRYQLKGYDKCIADAFSYSSVSDAIRENTSSKTIKLTANINENIVIPSGRTVTIDLNGFTLSAKEDGYLITNNGTLILKNQQSSGKYNGQIKNTAGSVLTIESGALEASNMAAIENEGTLNVCGGTITGILTTAGTVSAKGGKIKSALGIVPIKAQNSNTVVNIEGSNLDGSFTKYALRLESAASANITSGTIVGGENGAIGLISGKAAVVISNDAIIKGSIYKNNDGKVTALGGWYSSPVDKSWLTDGAVPSTKIASGPSGAQYTILITFVIDLNFEGNPKVYKYEISSGTIMKEPDEPVRQGYSFKGWYADKNGKEIYDFNSSVNEPTTIYACWTDSDPWNDKCTGECKHEVRVGQRHYDTIQDAFEYADNNATLVVLRDFKTYATVPSSKTFTLDLNGHVISQVNEKKSVLVNNGTLTIKDSSGTNSGKISIPNQTGNVDTMENSGTLTLESGTIYSGNAYACAILNAGGTLDIKGGSVKSALSYAIYNRESTTTYGIVNISGGNIEALLYGVWTTGNGKLSVTGGLIHSLKSCAIMNGVDESDTRAMAGVTEISGGTVKTDAVNSDAACIYNHCGTVTVLPNEKDRNYPQLIGISPLVNATNIHQNYIKGGWYSAMLIPDSFTRVISVNGDKLSATSSISSGPADAKYTVGYKITYNMNYSGGKSVVTYAPVTTGKFGYIADPSRSDAVFDGWYLDKNGTSQANIGQMVVSSDTTIYAKWNKGTQANVTGEKIFVNSKYFLTIKTPKNGKLSAQVLEGTTVKVTLTPNDGYQVASIFMDGNYAGDGYKSYKITLKNDTTIAATFLPKTLSAEEYREEIEKQKNDSYDSDGDGIPDSDEKDDKNNNSYLTDEKKPKRPSNNDDSNSSNSSDGYDSGNGGSGSSGKSGSDGSSNVTNKNGEDYDPGSNYNGNVIKPGQKDTDETGKKVDSQGWIYQGEDIDKYIPSEEELTHLSIDRTLSVEEQIKQAKEILALFNLTARSGYATSPKGKKAIKIIWYDKKYSMDIFDGVEIYRSTKRFKGYGKKPKFETILGRYYNTAIKKGTKYYYKMRGYIEIDGTRYYTGWSIKAIRKAKY